MSEFPLSGRPGLPPHLLAQAPTHLVATPMPREKSEQIIEAFIQGLQRVEHVAQWKIRADQDADGWTIRIDFP